MVEPIVFSAQPVQIAHPTMVFGFEEGSPDFSLPLSLRQNRVQETIEVIDQSEAEGSARALNAAFVLAAVGEWRRVGDGVSGRRVDLLFLSD